MSILYIGLPFSRWQEEDLRRDEEMQLAAFAAAGLSLVPVNGGPEGERICQKHGWPTQFVTEEGLPDDEFLADRVFWEDYLLLYISAGAALGDAAYQQFVTRAAQEGADEGLFVAADLWQKWDIPWRNLAHIIWNWGDKPLPPEGNCRLSLCLSNGQLSIAGREKKVYHESIKEREKIPMVLKRLMQGVSLEEAIGITDERNR